MAQAMVVNNRRNQQLRIHQRRQISRLINQASKLIVDINLLRDIATELDVDYIVVRAAITDYPRNIRGSGYQILTEFREAEENRHLTAQQFYQRIRTAFINSGQEITFDTHVTQPN